MLLGFNWLCIGIIGGLPWTLGPIKRWAFLDYLAYYQLLSRDSLPCGLSGNNRKTENGD
jgi:hypothetical protein